MKANLCSVLAAIASFGLAQPASADVIADWNEKAVAYVLASKLGPPPAERIVAMTQVAMFDAVEPIERRYQPYLAQPRPPRPSPGSRGCDEPPARCSPASIRRCRPK